MLGDLASIKIGEEPTISRTDLQWRGVIFKAEPRFLEGSRYIIKTLSLGERIPAGILRPQSIHIRKGSA